MYLKVTSKRKRRSGAGAEELGRSLRHQPGPDAISLQLVEAVPSCSSCSNHFNHPEAQAAHQTAHSMYHPVAQGDESRDDPASSTQARLRKTHGDGSRKGASRDIANLVKYESSHAIVHHQSTHTATLLETPLESSCRCKGLSGRGRRCEGGSDGSDRDSVGLCGQRVSERNKTAESRSIDVQ